MATINIGLNVNDGSSIAPDVALAALRTIGGVSPRKWAVHQSASEPTIVVEADALTGTAAYEVARYLKQDAIAQWDGRDGDLYGPNAQAWGNFDPAFFLTLDGSVLERRLAA